MNDKRKTHQVLRSTKEKRKASLIKRDNLRLEFEKSTNFTTSEKSVFFSSPKCIQQEARRSGRSNGRRTWVFHFFFCLRFRYSDAIPLINSYTSGINWNQSQCDCKWWSRWNNPFVFTLRIITVSIKIEGVVVLIVVVGVSSSSASSFGTVLNGEKSLDSMRIQILNMVYLPWNKSIYLWEHDCWRILGII